MEIYGLSIAEIDCAAGSDRSGIIMPGGKTRQHFSAMHRWFFLLARTMLRCFSYPPSRN